MTGYRHKITDAGIRYALVCDSKFVKNSHLSTLDDMIDLSCVGAQTAFGAGYWVYWHIQRRLTKIKKENKPSISLTQERGCPIIRSIFAHNTTTC